MLVSRDLGQKTVMHVTHPITGQSMLEEIYLPADQRTIVTLMPNEKQYSKIEVDEATIEQWQSENDPRRSGRTGHQVPAHASGPVGYRWHRGGGFPDDRPE